MQRPEYFSNNWIAILLLLSGLLFQNITIAQVTPSQDSFFLARKKGLLGKLGKSLQTLGTDTVAVAVENPFLAFEGKVIGRIYFKRMSIDGDLNDTLKVNQNFGTRLANSLHRTTVPRVIRNNLFFEEGDTLNPYLLADNERHLREQTFIQDARILVIEEDNLTGLLDILVITKDVFSIGGAIDIKATNRFQFTLKEENLGGSGNRLAVSTLYDAARVPKWGWGAEWLKRNVNGSFINWTIGMKSFNTGFNSNRHEEVTWYTGFEKPLITPYMPWVGGVDFSYNFTNNNYGLDTIFKQQFQYTYHRLDGWLGYNFGSKFYYKKNLKTRLRKFIALRGLWQYFYEVPTQTNAVFDQRYSNVNGVLASFNIFRQDFYRAKFIYGFGRNEDVPQGFSASFVTGYTNKEDSIFRAVRKRMYYGIDLMRSHYNKNGFYSSMNLRLGGYSYQGGVEDIDLLFSVDHFTRLKKMAPQWLQRFFIGATFTQQFKPVINAPLMLNSAFGLPYFNFSDLRADFRATLKTESVFFNLRKFWGFRFAPFVFGDASLLHIEAAPGKRQQLYSAIGAGVRTRNENLIFGTIELKGFYFPRTLPEMGKWRIQVGTNIRFKYNSSFIKKPDFISAN